MCSKELNSEVNKTKTKDSPDRMCEVYWNICSCMETVYLLTQICVYSEWPNEKTCGCVLMPVWRYVWVVCVFVADMFGQKTTMKPKKPSAVPPDLGRLLQPVGFYFTHSQISALMLQIDRLICKRPSSHFPGFVSTSLSACITFVEKKTNKGSKQANPGRLMSDRADAGVCTVPAGEQTWPCRWCMWRVSTATVTTPSCLSLFQLLFPFSPVSVSVLGLLRGTVREDRQQQDVDEQTFCTVSGWETILKINSYFRKFSFLFSIVFGCSTAACMCVCVWDT